MSRREDIERIAAALDRAREVLAKFTPGQVEHRLKDRGDPVTEADTAINDVLLESLPREGEGWLSEETVDAPARLSCERVWVVDPLDGTKEFVQGVPEWCVSVALVEGGRPVAGGIWNPPEDLTVIGSVEDGVRVNGTRSQLTARAGLQGASVLASRSEVKRGEWEQFRDAPFEVVPMGSVAYKMARVAAGLADATWTLVPKHEWDVAAGAALVAAAGGSVWTIEGEDAVFNRRKPKFRGLLAAAPGLEPPIREYLREPIASVLGS
ncbi:MAG: 3'(2'),5'-bisphosphate nucleotidase CysQ [bacterium]|nr:3'(2'),5'-bisphosphate nucleotidase CysQ [bacterium]